MEKIRSFREKINAETAIKWGSAAILAYELVCPEKQTISEGTDRLIEKHPVLTRAVIGTVALHLMNLLPEQIDPLHRISKAYDRFKSGY